jgi:hypothetical protein
MNKANSKTTVLKSFKILTAFTLITIFYSCKKEKSRICELYAKPVDYSIGTIESFVSSPFKAVYNYSFLVNGIEYNGKEKSYGIGHEESRLIGKRFVVIYEKNNPSNNDLNTDFYIETDLDFQNFESEYSTYTPSPDFPNKCK